MKRLFFIFISFCMAAALSAQLQERMVKVNVVPDHVDWKYELGEKVKFNVVVTKNCHSHVFAQIQLVQLQW